MTVTNDAIERVRKALAMRDAGYSLLPEPEDVAALLRQYDLLQAALTAGVGDGGRADGSR